MKLGSVGGDRNGYGYSLDNEWEVNIIKLQFMLI